MEDQPAKAGKLNAKSRLKRGGRQNCKKKDGGPMLLVWQKVLSKGYKKFISHREYIAARQKTRPCCTCRIL